MWKLHSPARLFQVLQSLQDLQAQAQAKAQALQVLQAFQAQAPPGPSGPGGAWCRIDPATPLEPHELVQLVCTVWHGVALCMALQSSQGKGQGLSLGQGLGLGLGQGLCPARGRRTEDRGQRTSVRSGRRTSRQACEQARYCLRELGRAFVPCTCRNYIRPRVCLSASRGVCVPRARAIRNPLPCRSCSSPSTTSAAAA